VLDALLASKTFNVTVLSRSSTNNFPAHVKVAEVDYDKPNSLLQALKGQDAIICTFSFEAIPSQRLLIDAAIASGVKRFIPSEFGMNLRNEKARKLPAYRGRVDIEDYLDEKAPGTQLTYTIMNCGYILDFGIRRGSIFDLKTHTARIADGGNKVFSASRLETVAKAVTGVLEYPEETANRSVFVQDIATTQNELISMAAKFTHGSKWKFELVDTVSLVARSDDAIAKGASPDEFLVRIAYIARSLWGDGYGSHFENLDNDLFGIKGMTEGEVESMMKQTISQDDI
jgi:hypothetical protein